MRKVTVNIGGQEYTLVMTVEALRQLTERCGGMDKLTAFLLGKGADGKIDAAATIVNTGYALGILIQEGEEYRLMEAACYGSVDTKPRRRVPGPDELKHFLTPGNIRRYQKPVMDAVQASMEQEVEAEPEKNVESGKPR